MGITPYPFTEFTMKFLVFLGGVLKKPTWYLGDSIGSWRLNLDKNLSTVCAGCTVGVARRAIFTAPSLDQFPGCHCWRLQLAWILHAYPRHQSLIVEKRMVKVLRKLLTMVGGRSSYTTAAAPSP